MGFARAQIAGPGPLTRTSFPIQWVCDEFPGGAAGPGPTLLRTTAIQSEGLGFKFPP